MTTREELYAKFGMTAEAAQLFETELETLLFGLRAIEQGWHVNPDPAEARRVLDHLDTHTLGRLLGALRDRVSFDESTLSCFTAALDARNRLNHGFFERHNFNIQTAQGREVMLADLERLHDTLSVAWQRASALTDTVVKLINRLGDKP